MSKLILCGILLYACSTGISARENNQRTGAWSTDVIGISEMHLSANYWVKQIRNADQVLKSPQEIAKSKEEVFSTDRHMVNLAIYPGELAGSQVREQILAISKPDKSTLSGPDKEILQPDTYQRYADNLGLDNIPETVTVRFALAVNRSDMRTYPTNDRYFRKKENQNLDRFQDVHHGFLPFTRANIIRQAFKFLGERYGWGHSNNARDCTGFVMEVYKSFGIYMPRNTSQQGAAGFGQNTRFTWDSTREEKLLALARMDIGDLIYVPGHVLIYIGDVDGETYVIRDVSLFRYTDDHGDYYEGTLNSVSVTPLIPLHSTEKSTYVDLMYNIKRIR